MNSTNDNPDAKRMRDRRAALKAAAEGIAHCEADRHGPAAGKFAAAAAFLAISLSPEERALIRASLSLAMEALS